MRRSRRGDEADPEAPEAEPPDEAEEWAQPEAEEEDYPSDVEESDVEEDPEPTAEEVGAFPIRVRAATKAIVKHGDITAYAAPGSDLVVVPLSDNCAIVSALPKALMRELGVDGAARVAIDIARIKLSGAQVKVGDDSAGFLPLAVYLVSEGVKALKKAKPTGEPAPMEPEVGARGRGRGQRGAKPPQRRSGDACGCDACRRGQRGGR